MNNNYEKNIINIGQINFVNCLPINYSFEKWDYNRIFLSNGHPQLLNKQMREEKIHIAPVSSAEYIENKDKYTLLDSICISSDGEVGSVVLFSNYKIDELAGKKIALPYTSKSSIVFLKIILKMKGIDLKEIEFSNHKYEETLSSSLKDKYDAVLYIGDPALVLNKNYNDCIKYDIGKLWKDLTGYPAVFGTWTANKDWALANKEDFEWIKLLLDKAVDEGLNLYLNEIIEIASKKLSLGKSVILSYLTQKIQYEFTPKHLESLNLFEQKALEYKILED